VSTLAVPCVPAQPTTRTKWQRLLASDKLKSLHVGNLCYVANEKVSVMGWIIIIAWPSVENPALLLLSLVHENEVFMAP
jgi:hypothetical protein